jgi:hypothetical protein
VTSAREHCARAVKITRAKRRRLAPDARRGRWNDGIGHARDEIAVMDTAVHILRLVEPFPRAAIIADGMVPCSIGSVRSAPNELAPLVTFVESSALLKAWSITENVSGSITGATPPSIRRVNCLQRPVELCTNGIR